MKKNALVDAINFVIYGADKKRMTIKISKNGVAEAYYDVHGLTVAETRRNVRNIINIARSPLELNIIHGYNHGHAIKDMLQEEDFGDKVKKCISPDDNKGKTIIKIIP